MGNTLKHFYVYYLHHEETGELLYIGRSNNPSGRRRAFEKRSGIVVSMGPKQRFTDIHRASAAELKAILQHSPPHNKNVVSSLGTYGMTCTGSARNLEAACKANSGRVVSALTRARMSAAHTGKKLGPCPEARKAKISAANKGRALTEEHKTKIGDGVRGIRRSEETKMKIAASHKGRTKTPEHRAAIRASMLALRSEKTTFLPQAKKY